jgi:hypothetical protein
MEERKGVVAIVNMNEINDQTIKLVEAIIKEAINVGMEHDLIFPQVRALAYEILMEVVSRMMMITLDYFRKLAIDHLTLGDGENV